MPHWTLASTFLTPPTSTEASLKRLNTYYIDLYQHHIPDPNTPIEETLSALNDLVSMGKVRYIGHSNYMGWQIADAHWCAKTSGYQPFVTAQDHYNLLQREIEKEVLPACAEFCLNWPSHGWPATQTSAA